MITAGRVIRVYQIKESYDDSTQEWVYTVTMPVEDKEELEKICSAAGYTIQDATEKFFKWLVAEPKKAVAWLKGEGE